MTTEWVSGIVSEVILIYGKPEIINSDQDCQFTIVAYISLLQKEKILISMNGKGRAIDNIFIERFWHSVKFEHLYLSAYEDGVSLYQGLSQYVEIYNHERLHQSIEYSTLASLYLVNEQELERKPCGQHALLYHWLTPETIQVDEPIIK